MQNYDIEMWRYARELKTPSSNPLLGHDHRANRRAVLQTVEIRLDDHGLRGVSRGPRPPGRRRIMVLGGSIALGWGVPEAETMQRSSSACSVTEDKPSRCSMRALATTTRNVTPNGT